MGGEGGTTWGENGTKGKMCGFLFTDFNRYVLYKNLLGWHWQYAYILC